MSYRIPRFEELLAVGRSCGRLSEAPHLWKDLVGWWPFQEGGGTTAYDLSGWGNDGTLTNMDPGTDWVVGEKGRALDFDGSDDYCAIPRGWVLGEGTLCAFTRLNSSPNGDVSCGQEGIVSGYIGMGFLHAATYTRFSLDQNNNADASGADAVDTWYHFAGVWDSTNMRIYRDAVLGGNDTHNGSKLKANHTFEIGDFWFQSSRTFHFPGQIAHVGIWSRGLSLPEIQQLYADPLAMGRLRRRVSPAVTAAAGGPFPHYIRRNLRGGLIGMGL